MFYLTEEVIIKGKNTEYVIHIWFDKEHIKTFTLKSIYDKRYEEYQFRVGLFLNLCNILNRDFVLRETFKVENIKEWFKNIWETNNVVIE